MEHSYWWKSENRRKMQLYIAKMVCTVSVNGKTAARHEGAALPFEIDITELLCEGENRLSVVFDNTLDPWAIPPAVLSNGYEGRMGFMNSYPAVTYDFFPYSGIHRSVTLSVVSKLRIKDITRV